MMFLPIVKTASAGNLFSDCRFHFGANSANPALMNEIDYMTAWAGSGDNFNMGNFFTACKNNNKTPVIMTYIIAFTARRDKGLQDCNVATPSLCQEGANYIRQNRTRIMGQYVKYAQGAAASFGATGSMVWCVEPDMIQYNYPEQNGGGLTVTQCGQLVNEMLDSIKKYCPNAVFSMDISPWKVTSWQKTWFEAMNISRFTFVNTSGGESKADQTYIKDTWSSDCPTWAWAYTTYGLPMIADAGYGPGGGGTGYDTRWMNVTNLTARIKDGVIAVCQANPGGSYASDIAGVRSQIPTPPKCPKSTAVAAPFESRDMPALNFKALSDGKLEIIDLSGRMLFSKVIAGDNLSWDPWKGHGLRMRPGAYIVRMRGNNQSLQKKVLVNE